ncbi:2-dehydro-3-deoxygalactonokinase [Paraburkholderia rhizosphaerae]|uniref:2-keto-3-deoxygalactonate kinase n=1 Tax=Paraburkholderia rhizosphaerae TaxID=480658 RepID=A0A4R8LUK2_9BURK|nr:2-dehydro-3-deoxygalactonokinase [Paraburkholderia rhizosphaerae]TDY50286.1 2-keto-3-deoxygalactonate kinase [Paraburkholderia rhizosphaerae]
MTDRASSPSIAAASRDAQQGSAGTAASRAVRYDAALIALDWGTTALRAYLFDAAGQLLETRASTAGIMNLPRAASEGGFDAAFDAVCGSWLDDAPHLPVIAAGMVGSAQGWKEAPYVETPASADAIVRGIVQVQTTRGIALNIVPGVLERGELPNVMRGEETQIFGALAAGGTGDAGSAVNPSAATGVQQSALIGLPGTHAKWVVVRGARIERFYTFMTGEVFAALSEHTILGRTMTTPDRPDTAAFLRGISVARNHGHAGVLATIFSTRTLGLTAQLTREEQPDYLSGLLIGHELNGLEAVLERQQATLAGRTLRLIGNEALCERYRLALTQFGCQSAELVKHATERGLWRIAVQAGLVTPAASAAPAARIG